MPKRADPRSQSKRERFRQQVLAAQGPVCRMPVCLMPTRAINLDLKPPHVGAYDADHITPLARMLELGMDPFDPSQGRPSHAKCNRSAGARWGNRRRGRNPRLKRTERLNTSRVW